MPRMGEGSRLSEREHQLEDLEVGKPLDSGSRLC